MFMACPADGHYRSDMLDPPQAAAAVAAAVTAAAAAAAAAVGAYVLNTRKLPISSCVRRQPAVQADQ